MLEHIVLILPPAVELVFSFTLAVTSASMEGKKRWILVLDGLSFFLLALTDFLAHIIPKVSSSVHVFSIVDTILAAASLLPLLFYTIFLFLFARTNLMSFIPTRFSRIIIFSLLAVIPTILATNEISSLIGIEHTSLTTSNHTSVVGVGFSTVFRQHLSLFFSAACLALLALFQAMLFVVAFVRLARGFIEERRIEAAKEDPQAREEIHLFRGLGWLAVGLKLGAIESVVGFANISFGAVVTRRVLRLFARGSLIIGVLKGLNVVEDISNLESDLRARSRSTRRSKHMSRRLSRVMISNPRLSTFEELSPEASSFHAAQIAIREKRAKIGPSPLALGKESNLAKFNGTVFNGTDLTEVTDPHFKEAEFKGSHFNSPDFKSVDSKNRAEFDSPGFNNKGVFDISRSSIARTDQRVTVHYDGQTPPVLQVRFSVVDMAVHPHPEVLALPNPYKKETTTKQNNLSNASPEWGLSNNGDIQVHNNGHSLDGGPKSAPLEAVFEDPREDQVSVSQPVWDRQLYYMPATASVPRTAPIPPRPPRDPRRSSYAAPSDPRRMSYADPSRVLLSYVAPKDPPRTSRIVSYAAPSFTSDVGMPFRDNGDREDSPSLRTSDESPRTSLIHAQYVSGPSQDISRPSHDSSRPQDDHTNSSHDTTNSLNSVSPSRDTTTANSLRRSTRTDRTASGASDSLEVVREIAARFPGLPPHVVGAGKSVHPGAGGAGGHHPSGLQQEAESDSDAEWRMMARARSLKRRRELEAQRQAQQQKLAGGSGGVMDISPVNSIRRKPPSSEQTQTQAEDVQQGAEAPVSQAILARAAVTGRSVTAGFRTGGHGHTESIDDPSSFYSSSSSSDDDGNDGESIYATRNTETPELELTPRAWTQNVEIQEFSPGSWIRNAATPELTPGPWTPTAASATPVLRTPPSFVGGNEPPVGQLGGRAMAVGLGENNNAYSSAQGQGKSQSPLQPRRQPQPQPQPQTQLSQGGQVRETTSEERRLHRLTLLRRELRASPYDSATANAALEAELQMPWLHTDPLSQLQTIGTGAALHVNEDEDEDVVLDDAWRRAGLTRIKSVSSVRVHRTPRVEQGFEVRGSLVAVEEEEDDNSLREPVSPMQEGKGARRASAWTLKKPARLDSGVLGEEDRKLIRQSIRA